MRINIISKYKILVEDVAETLQIVDCGEVTFRIKPATAFQLRHHSKVRSAKRNQILKSLRPLAPEVVTDDTLADCDVELHLGDTRPLAYWRPKIFCEVGDVSAGLRSDLTQHGFRPPRVNDTLQPADSLHYGGASDFARGVLLWQLARDGCQPTVVKKWGDDDRDIYVHLTDPAFRGAPLAERFRVTVKSDDPNIALNAIERLRRAGFKRSQIALVEAGSRSDCGGELGVDPGPLTKLEADIEVARLLAIVGDTAAEAGVDQDRYPVRKKKGRASEPTLFLPVVACRSGVLPPYAGAYPERFRVCLFTDDRRAGAALTAKFRAKGFERVMRRNLDDVTSGFCIAYGAVKAEPAILETAREVVEDHMCEIGADAVGLGLLDSLPAKSTDIDVHAPSAAFRDGRLARETENPILYNASILGGTADAVRAVSQKLEGLGFRSVKPGSKPDSARPRLSYGGAPRLLIDRIRTAVHEAIGVLLPIEKSWPITDKDIWLVLPNEHRVSSERQMALSLPQQSSTRRRPGAKGNGKAFLTIEPDYVEIGGMQIARRQDTQAALVPRLENLQPYCLDAITAETLCHIASAITLREPCALEGVTSTSKTTSIMFLASLLNQPVFRLNLNGQTDTGELIGRYVPARNNDWRFNEGLLVTAMREGYWMLLDEINLAEPAVIERLNPVLERHPSLVLSEHDNSVIDPPHERFRIFATLNPVGDYAGRQVMSAAFRDRWQAYRYVPRAREAEYAALAHLAIFGEQPHITLRNGNYGSCKAAATLGSMSGIRGIDTFLTAFARFQVSVEAAAEATDGGAPRLGADRREPYIFTRRGFMSTLRYMDLSLCGERGKRMAANTAWTAIDRYYLNRLASHADKTVVTELAHAVGIAENGWSKSS